MGDFGKNGKAVFELAAKVFRLLAYAYLFNALVYTIGMYVTFEEIIHAEEITLSFFFFWKIFRTFKAPIVHGYIAYQLYSASDSFRLILKTKGNDTQILLNGIKHAAKGMNRIKMPLIIGGIMNLVHYYGDLFQKQDQEVFPS